MRKLSRLFATKDAARGAAPRRRRKLVHLATAAESSAKLRVAEVVVDLDASVVDDGATALELEERAVADRHMIALEQERSRVRDLDATRRAGMDESREVLVDEGDDDASPDSSPRPSSSGSSGIPFDSGVYVSSRFTNADPNLVRQVTLVVYEWHNVEPGTLSWVFPSVQAALAAARAMKNAVKWAVIAGRRTQKVDVESERASGLVLVEQAG
ncbi:hypothetical protein LZC95_40665 [Pendulispora brunnea]|uniref:Uncharacterized protein n=1 Tax=Pendulispora brunnea TaxID=2905690 RepID=A0ABZ2K1Y4_9BACT